MAEPPRLFEQSGSNHGSWRYYNSGAYAGQNIALKIFGDWPLLVHVQVNGQWYS
jgi:hypothetical protein